MNWTGGRLRWTITESLGMHDTAQLGDDDAWPVAMETVYPESQTFKAGKVL